MKVVSPRGDKPQKEGLQGMEGLRLANPEPWLTWAARSPPVFP